MTDPQIARAVRNRLRDQLKTSVARTRATLAPTALAERAREAARTKVLAGYDRATVRVRRNRGKIIGLGIGLGAALLAPTVVKAARNRNKETDHGEKGAS